MNKLSYLYQALLATMIVGLLASCYEEENWLEDNITPTGEYFPTIYMNDLESEYKVGDPVSVVLEFASQGTLQEIILYQRLGDSDTIAIVSRSPYQPAFSEKKAQDTLALIYTVPPVSDTIDITLVAQAVNANGLSKSSGNTFSAVP